MFKELCTYICFLYIMGLLLSYMICQLILLKLHETYAAVSCNLSLKEE